LESFTKYWQNTGLRISDMNNDIHFWREKYKEEDAVVFSSSIPIGTTQQSFSSKYVVVKRSGLWFVTNGYLIIR
jgi:hypothetical protein